MGRMSRQKGKVGEREAAEFLRSHGIEARRGKQYRGDETAPDVVADTPFAIEVKRRETSAGIFDWLAETVVNAGGKLPVVLHRRNGKPWVAILRAEDWCAIVHALKAAKGA